MLHFKLPEQGQEVARTEEEHGQDENQLNESCGQIFLDSGAAIGSQEAANTKKDAMHPIRNDRGIEEGSWVDVIKVPKRVAPAIV